VLNLDIQLVITGEVGKFAPPVVTTVTMVIFYAKQDCLRWGIDKIIKGGEKEEEALQHYINYF
jgi:hypothetical protein